MALEPIFAGGQLPANLITTQQFQRGQAEAAPVQVALAVQVQQVTKQADEAADRATTVLPGVAATPNYDVHARVEPLPSDGQPRGRFFDQRA